MNITLTIEAPELVGAIESLASALGNASPLPLSLTDKPKPPTPAKEKEPVKETAPVKEETPKKEVAPEPESKPKVEEEQTISLEYVRGQLADFAKTGKPAQEAVKDALSRFGVKKLTEVEASDYKELLELIGLS